MFPAFVQLKLMRQRVSIVDAIADSSPNVDESSLLSSFLNCSWSNSGFKTIIAGDALLAHLLATG